VGDGLISKGLVGVVGSAVGLGKEGSLRQAWWCRCYVWRTGSSLIGVVVEVVACGLRVGKGLLIDVYVRLCVCM